MGRPRKTPAGRSDFGNIIELPSGKFRARYREPGTGQQVGQTFHTRAEASLWLKRQKIALVDNAYVSPNKSKMTFAEVAEEWERNLSTNKRKTGRGYKSTLHSRVLPYWKDWAIGDITPLDIRAWFKSQEDEAKKSTRNNRRTVLSKVLQTAVEGRYILTNPCWKIGVGKADDEQFEAVFLTTGQAIQLAERVKMVEMRRWGVDLGHDLAVLLAAFSGPRAEEVWAARTLAIDFNQELFRIYRANDGALPKNGQMRAVPIPSPLLERLERFVKENNRQPEDYLFQSLKGFQVGHSTFSERIFRPARGECGFPEEPRFHDLRHTCATIYFDSGATAEVVARVLGDEVATIRKHYEHVYPDAFTRRAAGISAVVQAAFDASSKALGGVDVSRGCHDAFVEELEMSLPIAINQG